MGVPNYAQYTCTNHAKERYLQRIDPDIRPDKIVNKIWGKLANSVFLQNQGSGCQIWLHEDSKTVFVLNPSQRKVITCYLSDGKDVDPLELAFRQISPELKEMLTRTAKQFRNSTIKQSSQRLGKLYRRTAEIHNVLAHTKRGDVITNYYKELNNIQQEIMEIEQRRDALLEDVAMVV